MSLSEVVEKCGHLCDGGREQLYSLLIAYGDIFAWDKTNFGQTSQIQHRIEAGEATPIW